VASLLHHLIVPSLLHHLPLVADLLHLLHVKKRRVVGFIYYFFF